MYVRFCNKLPLRWCTVSKYFQYLAPPTLYQNAGPFEFLGSEAVIKQQYTYYEQCPIFFLNVSRLFSDEDPSELQSAKLPVPHRREELHLSTRRGPHNAVWVTLKSGIDPCPGVSCIKLSVGFILKVYVCKNEPVQKKPYKYQPGEDCVYVHLHPVSYRK